MIFVRDNWNDIFKFFVFYLHNPCLFYSDYNQSVRVLFCFYFPFLILDIILQSVKEMLPSQRFTGAMS